MVYLKGAPQSPRDDSRKLHGKRTLQTLLRDDKYRFIVGGHTHQRMVRTCQNASSELIFINAGTLSRLQSPSFATVDFAGRNVQFHDFEDELLIPDCQRITF